MHWKAPQDSTLLEALITLATDSSKNTIRSWIKEGRIELEGKVVKDGKQKVRQGEVLSLTERKHYMDHGIEVLFEDDHLICLYKPEGLLSVATELDPFFNVHSFLKQRFHSRRVYPVHRLDRETSGVMLFAYNEEAKEDLKKQFEVHSIERKYYAIVEGNVLEDQGTWKSYLEEVDAYHVFSSDHPGRGKLAITHFKVLQRASETTLLEVTLETGRKNQIRVQASKAGHPVLGDKKYKASISYGKRVYLHAAHLGFVHPFTKKKMVFTKEPEEFFFQGLKFWKAKKFLKSDR